MQDINKRLDRIEERLYKIEQKLGLDAPVPMAKPTPLAAKPAVAANQSPQLKKANTLETIKPTPTEDAVSATKILGWCAGLTFLLAMSYFLKLVYDTGWLTPERQIGLAYSAAVILILIGIVLERHDHQYASYLPAVGLVVLFLATFTAHLYYHLWARNAAIGLVSISTLTGIWLTRKFERSIYTIFAAVGVYLSPMLIHSNHPVLMDLVIFYTAWSLLFSFAALQEARRVTYVLPMYLAILGFDVIWRFSGHDAEWLTAACYELIQFAIFASTTVAFSIIHQRPLRADTTLFHGLALFMFYGIEYAILKEHVPELVNYIAVLSAVVVFAIYAIANTLYSGNESLKEGATLVSYYCALVAVHAVYFGIVPVEWMSWAILLVPVVFVLLAPKLADNKAAMFPVTIACLALFAIGYLSLVECVALKTSSQVPQPVAALLCYVVLLYALYYYLSRPQHKRSEAVVTLYAGHLALMACLVNIIDQDIYLSAIWAAYAVGLLVLALRISNKEIGRSALLIFTASGLKVLLFDLHDSNSLVRVIVLLALSVSLYLGGWLYQSLVRGVEVARSA